MGQGCWASAGPPRSELGSVCHPGWSLFAFGLHLARMETLSLLLEINPAFIKWGSQL